MNQHTTKTPKTIAMLVDAWFPFVGGGQIHVRELSKELMNNYGVNVVVFAPPHPHIVIRTLWSVLVPIWITISHIWRRFDLLHSHGYNSGFAAKLSSIIIGKPVVHTVHGSNLLDQGSQEIKATLEKWLLTRIKYSAQITVSRTFLAHPNVNKNIYAIPNGVDVTAFDQITSPTSKKPTIIWVGRKSDPVKGYDYLLKAVSQLKQKFPDLQLVAITNGNKQGKALIKAYKQAHVFVLPSLSEGQPITLLEAWAAKLPVVVTAVGENPYMVADGKNGYLVQPRDVEDLVDRITLLLSNPDRASKMGQIGYEIVTKSYTWDHITQQIWQVYQSVCNE